MKKLKLFLPLVLILLHACVHDSQLKPINPYHVFHDNNSKVWLVNHAYKNKVDHAPLSTVYKQIIVFHASKTCYFYKLNEIGEKTGKKADFTLDIKTKRLIMEFKNQTWRFHVRQYSPDKIILVPKDTSVFAYTLELIPLPEF